VHSDTLSLSQPATQPLEPRLEPLAVEPPLLELPLLEPAERASSAVLAYSPKPNRVGLHILNKLDLNAMSKDKPVIDPSALLPSLPLTTRLYIKRTLPIASSGQLLSPRHQRAYGSSDLPMNDYEQLLFELNTLLPIAGILRVGPYSVPLLVLRFVVDKTGRFLVLVTCPWCPNHNVFSLFHFFKNMLHMLHQMDHDNRFRLLRDFGESQVPLPTLSFLSVLSVDPNKKMRLSVRCTRIFFSCSTTPATNSRTRGLTSSLATYGFAHSNFFLSFQILFCAGLRTANWTLAV
jgi:hypothetical protein